MERKFLELSLGTFAPEERKFHRSESSMERKFLDFSLPGSECSTERKTKVPRNESSTGAKVLSMVFSLPGTKVQRNEKASYPAGSGRFLGMTDFRRIKFGGEFG